MSCQHQATLFLERPREPSTMRAVPGAVTVSMVKRDVTDIFSTDNFVAKTRFKKCLNVVLNAKEVRTGPSPWAVPTSRSKSASACTSRSPPPSSSSPRASCAPHWIANVTFRSVSLRASRELPLATDLVQRETFFLFRHLHRPHGELTIRTCHGADGQRCVLDLRDQEHAWLDSAGC